MLFPLFTAFSTGGGGGGGGIGYQVADTGPVGGSIFGRDAV